MCGIAGIFGGIEVAGGLDAALRLVGSMSDSLSHRGPDAHGVWADEAHRCVLGHRRLSIIDLSEAGAQPMEAAGTPWVLTFNGEIYNFRDLRRELESLGVRFTGHSDTEVLLQAIATWGSDVIPRLDGMFAFAAFNRATGELLAARDPFGEKPFYYCDAGPAGIAFASELQALELLPWFRREVPIERVAEMLMFQYVGAPRTIYAAASKLPPGHLMRVHRDGTRTVEQYFAYRPEPSATDDRPLWTAADELEDILTASLERRLVSDVPLGALLSGGVDSATTCALVRRRLGLPLKSFSLGFRGAPESEAPVAAAFAAAIGSEHHELIVDAQAVEFLRDAGTLMDEPNGDVSCFPTYVLSRLVREHVTVAVSGDGGDELFGGYGRYLHTLDELDERPLSPFGDEYYSGRILVMDELEIAALFGWVPAAVREHLTALRRQVESRRVEALAGMRETDGANYMPGAVLAKVDRMSMRHSLEVRTPFLSTDVARFAEPLPDRLLVGSGYGKLVLREVACRYLPRELIDLPKKGFGLPSQQWATEEILALATERLGDSSSRLRQAIGRERMSSFLRRPYRLEPLWAMLTLESWLREHRAEIVGSDAASRLSEGPVPVRRRRARWLTRTTLLVADEEFLDAGTYAEARGATPLGRGVADRLLRSLRAVRPLLRAEEPVSGDPWHDLGETADLKGALARAGLDVSGCRVVWLRSDALVAHGRRSLAVGRGPAGWRLVSGIRGWSIGAPALRSDAGVVGPARALLVLNPLDATTPLPVVAHHQRVPLRRLFARSTPPSHVPEEWPPQALADRIEEEVAWQRSDALPPGSRVLVLTHALPAGGAERQWCYLARGLRERGLDARLVTTHELRGPDAHYLALAQVAGVPVEQLVDLGSADILAGIEAVDLTSPLEGYADALGDEVLRLSAYCRPDPPRALLAQLDNTNVVTGLAGLRIGTPAVVLSFRNYNPDNFSYMSNDWFRRAYAVLGGRPEIVLTGNSRAGNDDYADWMGVDRTRVAVIPNAVERNTVSLGGGGLPRTDVRASLGIPSDAPMIIGIFRASEEKRPELFVEVCARACNFIPDLQVVHIGTGPLADRMAAHAARHGLENFQMLGPRRDVAELLAASDLLLLTSRFEGMPNVALEAQLAGVPVVGPPVGALAEVVVDGVTGIITDDDAGSLARAVALVLGDRATWRDRVREHAAESETRYSVSTMAAAYAESAGIAIA